MALNRRKTLGALGLAAVAAALPASAATAAVRPEIINSGASPTPEGGAWVYVGCAVPVVLVTARLYNSAQTVELGSYELRLTEGHSPLEGVWIGPPLTGVPLGNHRVVYEATSADGLVATASGLFFIWRTAIYTCSVQPEAIDEDHRVVIVSGRVMGEHPVSHEVTAVAGLRLKAFAWYITPPPGQPQFTEVFMTTAPDGGFSTQMTLARPGTVTVGTDEMPHDTLVDSHGTGLMTVSVNKWQTRLSLQLDAVVLEPGQSATAEGHLEVMRDGQWGPLAGRTVDLFLIEALSGSTIAITSPVTDAQGRFRLRVVPGSRGHYSATFNKQVTSPDPFYDEASAVSASVFVRAPATFSDYYFNVQRTPSTTDSPWRYELTGIIYTAENPPPIQVHYRSGSAGDWRTLTTTVPDHTSYNGGYTFTASFTMPSSGQIRAYVERSNFTQEAVSKVVTVDVRPQLTPTLPQRDGDADPRPRPPMQPERPQRR